jgi:hypothetical protein
MSNFAIYMIGMILVIGALAYGAHLVGISQTWILIGAAVILGLGVMGGVSKTRQKEAPPSS